ncbi:MAG: RmlC-like protein [Paenibacillus sp.]|nr:RmlC-like protein [Paenibacillus sp.]
MNSISKTPLKLIDDRVWRTYAGGASLDRWKQSADPQDSDFPELWVASTVKAVNVGRESLPVEGLSKVSLPEAEGVLTLKALIEQNPELFLGVKHAERYEASPGILVKLLDSSERLTIQVHPDREFALQEFNSRFGKTEAWYILEGRTIEGEAPYVLLGFKPEVTEESWRILFEKQDIPGMIDALHKVYVQPGDVFLIQGGLPHAIGSGCFLIEIQEPTDLTLRTERTTPRGVSLKDQACHQGIGFERMLQCFHYEATDLDGALHRSKVQPEIAQVQQGGTLTNLIQAQHTDRFRLSRLNVTGDYVLEKTDEFAAAIIVSGQGLLEYANQGALALQQGDTLFLPAGLDLMTWKNTNPSEDLVVVLCFPPS